MRCRVGELNKNLIATCSDNIPVGGQHDGRVPEHSLRSRVGTVGYKFGWCQSPEVGIQLRTYIGFCNHYYLRATTDSLA